MDAHAGRQAVGSAGGAGESYFEASSPAATVPDEARPPLPPLPARLGQVVFSPGRLTAALAEDPKWAGALLVTVALATLQMALIPPEMFAEAQRQAALGAGRDFPEMSREALGFIRIFAPLATALATVVFTFLFAGLYGFVFAFVLGDEGRFRQYLAMAAHGWVIPAIVGLLLTPLRLSTGDPQLSLNLASFALFLPDGYWLGVLRYMDLTQIWATLVVAQGAHAIDPRRSFAGAAAILLCILLALALALAAVIPA